MVIDLPNSPEIDVANVKARFNVVYKREIDEESSFVIEEMKKVIKENQECNTGFLMSTSTSYGRTGRTYYGENILRSIWT